MLEPAVYTWTVRLSNQFESNSRGWLAMDYTWISQDSGTELTYLESNLCSSKRTTTNSILLFGSDHSKNWLMRCESQTKNKWNYLVDVRNFSVSRRVFHFLYTGRKIILLTMGICLWLKSFMLYWLLHPGDPLITDKLLSYRLHSVGKPLGRQWIGP